MNEPLPDPAQAFEAERAERVATYAQDREWADLSNRWLTRAFERKYMYNFSWMGRPVIQNPNDLMAMQELIWTVKPDLVVETGIAHGGSLLFHASMLELLGAGEVLGIDIDIRAHNRAAIEAHPMARRVRMIEGSSTSADVVAQVREIARGKRVLVILDSNHTHEHVLAELEAYAPLVSPGSYCVVFDTIVEDLPGSMFPDRPWSPGDNPKTAVHAYLAALAREGRTAADGGRLTLAIDKSVEDKLVITVAPDGFLKRVEAE